MSASDARKQFLFSLVALTLSAVVSSYFVKKIFSDNAGGTDSKALARQLGKPEIAQLRLNSHEMQVADCVITNSEIEVTFDDIGGLQSEIEEIEDNVIFPMRAWNSTSRKANCPTGVLLYGQPGTGKTLLATAIARESGSTFLNIKASLVHQKYYGESEKVVAAIFSLAKKLAPSVIFIDEIDTLLGSRSADSTNNFSNTTKGLFLQEWDGLGRSTENTAGPVIVIGATNRPANIDSAVLRRLPVSIEIKVPGYEARLDILQKLCNHENLSEDVDLEEVASRTESFCGSDLKELVRVAAARSLREFMVRSKTSATQNEELDAQNSGSDDAAFICQEHFEYALSKTKKTESAAKTFQHSFENSGSSSNIHIDPRMLEGLVQLLRMFSGPRAGSRNPGP